MHESNDNSIKKKKEVKASSSSSSSSSSDNNTNDKVLKGRDGKEKVEIIEVGMRVKVKFVRR